MTYIEIFNEIASWILLYLLLWNGYFLLVNKGVPNIRTAPAIRKKIIEILRQDMREKGEDGYTIIDLGCGNGTFSRQLARSFPRARVIGIEISKLSFLKAEAARKLHKIDNLEHLNADFMEYDLSNADAVLIYLTIYEMEKVGEKLKKELKQGALATSNRFKLGAGWNPVSSQNVRTLYPHQKTLHLYRA